MAGLRIPHIQRREKVTIFINGRKTPAYRGETVWAALIASGRKVLKRSARLGEGRGAFCGMGICYECLVTVNGVPNQRACMAEVEDRMEIEIHEPRDL